MAKPRPKRRRPGSLRVALSPDEKAALKAAADRTATPLAIWVRALALEKARAVDTTS